jgi:hypothetical protein
MADSLSWLPDMQAAFSGCTVTQTVQFARWFFVEQQACNCLWKSVVPANIGLFGWRIFHDSLDTRMNLWQCGILRNPHQQRDIMCFYWVRVPRLLTSIILLAYKKNLKSNLKGIAKANSNLWEQIPFI